MEWFAVTVIHGDGGFQQIAVRAASLRAAETKAEQRGYRIPRQWNPTNYQLDERGLRYLATRVE
jgi:hypothetical protein